MKGDGSSKLNVMAERFSAQTVGVIYQLKTYQKTLLQKLKNKWKYVDPTLKLRQVLRKKNQF